MTAALSTATPPPLPPPAEGAPPPLTPGGRTALRVALVIAAAVLVTGSVVALGVTAWGVSAVRVIADDETLPQDMRSLTIDTGDIPAAVRLTTDRDAAEPRVSMRTIKAPRSSDQTLVVAQEPGGTRLTVEGDRSRFMDWGRAGMITVTLPPDLSRRLSVTVVQAEGVLLAQGDLDVLVARNTDGAVVLSGSARRVDIRTQDGNVVARGPVSVSESFDVQAVDGDVSVGFRAAPPRRIDVDTVDGDIAISLPNPGPYLVRASGDSTSIRVPETNDPARAAAEVTLRSNDGDVVVDTRGRR